MSRTPFPARAAFVLMTLFGAAGGLFAAGYAFEDPGGWSAVGLVAAWLVPLVALATYAVARPGRATLVLTVVTAVLALLLLLNALAGLVDRDTVGPVDSLAVLVLATAIGFLGLHRPRRAGVLIVTLALAQLVAVLLTAVGQQDGDGPPPEAVLGGSSGAVVVPLLLIGALFLVAGGLEPVRPPDRRSRDRHGSAAGRPGP